VRRQFTAAELDRLWVADITYLRNWEGFLYLRSAAVSASGDVNLSVDVRERLIER
jgi:transposase InsO family protein